MPVFSYRATSLDGAITEGVIEAAEESSAVDKLRNSGVIPLQVTRPKEKSRAAFRFRSYRRDLLVFTGELSALLNAGLALDRSLNILVDISESREMKTVVRSVLKSIREGKAFSDALESHPDVFPAHYVSMVRAGEAGGVLGMVLSKLNEFQESGQELRDNLISAMIYPILLVGTGLASIFLLLTFVLPRFSAIFSELGTALPLPTQVVISLSHFLGRTWWLLGAAGLIAWILFRSYIRSETGRYRWDRLKLKLLGEITVKLETARFCRTLGTLLKSGVPLLQALQNARSVMGNRVISTAIDHVLRGVKEGRGLAVPLSDVTIFPPLALSMIKVGEETGQLDSMLLKVATTYEHSLKAALKRFLSLVEPVMILVMGLLIGFIVIAMLMAIFSITDLPM
jgi:general secretion pathway protein F